MDLHTNSFSKIPPTFQSDLFAEVARLISKGQCLQLVGGAGIGSSLIVKALTQSVSIQNKHSLDNYSFFLLDGADLLERTPFNLAKLLLSELSSEPVREDSTEIFKKIDQKILETTRRARTVIIIDHLSYINFPELKPFFVNLHNTQRTKAKIQFIFITNEVLDTHNQLSNFGTLAPLMVQNIIKIPMLNKKDSGWFLTEKIGLSSRTISGKDRDKIFYLSGGHPRTIKRLAESISRGFAIEDIEVNPEIDPSLALHLQEIKSNGLDLPILKSTAAIDKNTKEIYKGFSLPTLTKNEEKVMRFLYSNKDTVVDREDVIEYVWGEYGKEISDHAYDQIIHRLRQKLIKSRPAMKIVTFKGRGHMIK